MHAIGYHLYSAVKTGDLAQIEDILQCPINFNCFRVNGEETLLHYAVVTGHPKVVALLIDKISVNALDTKGNTPLHRAIIGNESMNVYQLMQVRRNRYRYGVMGSQLEIIRLFLDHHRTDPNASNKYGRTPLSQLIRYGIDLRVLKLMLSRGARVERVDKVITQDVCPVRYEAVKMLLEKAKEQKALKRVLSIGHPLHVCARMGDTKMIQLLLAFGADPNAIDEHGNSCLKVLYAQNPKPMLAIFDRGAAKTLIEHGAIITEDITIRAAQTKLYGVLQECLKQMEFGQWATMLLNDWKVQAFGKALIRRRFKLIGDKELTAIQSFPVAIEWEACFRAIQRQRVLDLVAEYPLGIQVQQVRKKARSLMDSQEAINCLNQLAGMHQVALKLDKDKQLWVYITRL